MTKKKLRPKGCKRTISGRHLPAARDSLRQGCSYGYGSSVMVVMIELYCTACGLIDDTGTFARYLYGKPKKVDDTKL